MADKQAPLLSPRSSQLKPFFLSENGRVPNLLSSVSQSLSHASLCPFFSVSGAGNNQWLCKSAIHTTSGSTVHHVLRRFKLSISTGAIEIVNLGVRSFGLRSYCCCRRRRQRRLFRVRCPLSCPDAACCLPARLSVTQDMEPAGKESEDGGWANCLLSGLAGLEETSPPSLPPSSVPLRRTSFSSLPSSQTDARRRRTVTCRPLPWSTDRSSALRLAVCPNLRTMPAN